MSSRAIEIIFTRFIEIILNSLAPCEGIVKFRHTILVIVIQVNLNKSFRFIQFNLLNHSQYNFYKKLYCEWFNKLKQIVVRATLIIIKQIVVRVTLIIINSLQC